MQSHLAIFLFLVTIFVFNRYGTLQQQIFNNVLFQNMYVNQYLIDTSHIYLSFDWLISAGRKFNSNYLGNKNIPVIVIQINNIRTGWFFLSHKLVHIILTTLKRVK